MNQHESKKHMVDVLAVLALFAFFAVTGVMLIALGASIYRRNVERTADNYDLRASTAYLAGKVRQGDVNKEIEVGNIDDLSALLIHETINDVSYTTYLYLQDGALCELFSRSDLSLPAAAGTKIMDLVSMDFTEISDECIRVDLVEPDGTARSLILKIRSDALAFDLQGDAISVESVQDTVPADNAQTDNALLNNGNNTDTTNLNNTEKTEKSEENKESKETEKSEEKKESEETEEIEEKEEDD